MKKKLTLLSLIIVMIIFFSAKKQVISFSGEKGKFIWVSSPGTQFTDEEFRKMANEYQIVVIDNAHGYTDFESYNTVARQLVSLNPNIKVFPYYNMPRRFNIINSGTGFNENWYLKDLNGNLVYDEGSPGHQYYDLSNANYRAWAVNFIVNWVNQAPFAGIALDDANPQELRSWVDQIGQSKADAWNNGRVQFVRQVKQALGNKFVFYNGITNNYSEYLDNNSADGALNEMFCYQKNSQTIYSNTKQIDQIEFMKKYAQKGKIILQKTNLNPNPRKSSNPSPIPSEKQHISRLCLGSFLLGFMPSTTYYKAGGGYRAYGGEIDTNALEIDLDFGNPLSLYEQIGNVYRRHFANGWIYVNMETSEQTINSPGNFYLGNGGVQGRRYLTGDKITIPSKDALYLFKAIAFITSTPTPTSIPPISTLTSIPTTTLCPRKNQGDANCDSFIDGADYSIWLNSQCHAGINQQCADKRAEFNQDQNVDDTDYAIWFNNRYN